MGDTGRESDIGVEDSLEMGELTFYKFIMDSLPIAILTVSADFSITGFNPWAEEVTGYSGEEAIGHHCGEILKGEMCGANCTLKAVLKCEKPITQVETTIYNKQGGLVPVRMNSAVFFDDDDNLIGGVEAF